MNNLQIFRNSNFGEVRVKEKNNDVWFAAVDICNILDIGNSSDAVRRINDRWVDKIEVPHPQSNTKTIRVNAVNEPGLYKLVFKSNKPEAEEFTDWIAEEVLPEIRQTGQYISKPKSVEDMIIMQAESVKKLKRKVDHQEEQIQSIKEAVIHTDQDWRNWVNRQLNSIAFRNKNYKEIRRQSYDILENRGRCRLEIRLSNLKERLEQAGAKKSKINKVSKLDVIEEDPRLKEIYTSIVEKLVIKYSA
jgi:prophage antirepressor-like protein